jgi:hypothetical protein
LPYLGNVTGRPESDIDLSIRNERGGILQTFGRLVEGHVGQTDSDRGLRRQSGFVVAAASNGCCSQEGNP